MKLEGKVSLITGGGRGIGRAMGLKFAEEGSDIVVWDIEVDETASLESRIEKLGRRVTVMKTDVSKYREVSEKIEEVLTAFGRVDVLVNNAGVTRDGLVLRMGEEDWDVVLDVNLKGAFNCTKAVTKSMVKQRWGRIINISSVIGVTGNRGQANYAASKAGLIGLTKAMAKELASRGITVNAIAPGLIQSGMTETLSQQVKDEYLKDIPLGRIGSPEDVAGLALFLASDEASYITGQVINVDGGMVM